jgi:hypothetical protein
MRSSNSHLPTPLASCRGKQSKLEHASCSWKPQITEWIGETKSKMPFLDQCNGKCALLRCLWRFKFTVQPKVVRIELWHTKLWIPRVLEMWTCRLVPSALTVNGRVPWWSGLRSNRMWPSICSSLCVRTHTPLRYYKIFNTGMKK